MTSLGAFVLAIGALSCDAAFVQTNATRTSAFMLVAGTSAAEEICLVENADKMTLASCAESVAAGDGREIWSFLSAGQLMSAVSQKCAGLRVGESSLSMSECGSASKWKLLQNGQVQVGDKCLSQTGKGAGTENVAAHSAAVATSSVNAFHAAHAAVDMDSATFWASKPGDAGLVTITVNLGEPRVLNLMKINWEFPAQSFAISVSLDGQQWTEVFATTVNMVNLSRIPLGPVTAREVRVDMMQPRHLEGAASGQVVYGIRSLALFAPRLEVALDDCTSASKSTDARDKYFAIPVSAFDPSAVVTLRGELPALVAAKASLSTALSAVEAANRKFRGCGSAAIVKESFHLASQKHGSLSGGTGSHSEGVVDMVSSMNGVDEADVKNLLVSARSTIVGARAAALG